LRPARESGGSTQSSDASTGLSLAARRLASQMSKSPRILSGTQSNSTTPAKRRSESRTASSTRA
jgi:hypothetical protein